MIDANSLNDSLYYIAATNLPQKNCSTPLYMTGFGGRELYPTITEKAAALWYKIATNQVFRNGNKRTALLAAIYFMGINFYTFDVCNGNEMYDMSVRAANKQISQNQIERYISEHVSLGYENMSAVINGGDFKLNVKIEINNSEE